MTDSVYQRLTDSGGEGDAFDRHIFACVLAIAATDHNRRLTEAVGLAGPVLAALVDRTFSGGRAFLPAFADDDTAGEDALEEPDLRQLLLDHVTNDGEPSRWLAAMVARRSLGANHLWQDLGLPNRGDLSRLLSRHFGPLAEQNVNDMKWKKFFYRQLCQREGIVVCKAPNCEVCTDFAICFGGEAGDPLPLASIGTVATPTKSTR